ncbi:Uncharacterised protein [Mycobacterium tuberculosis]|nr:Uncharacterised protein [Mycobacterium tuberculosis]
MPAPSRLSVNSSNGFGRKEFPARYETPVGGRSAPPADSWPP